MEILRANRIGLLSLPLLLILVMLASCVDEHPTPSVHASSPETDLIRNALARFEQQAGKDWPPPSKLISEARQARRSRDQGRLLKLVQLELRQNPNSEEASLMMAQLLFQRSVLSAALPLVELVLEQGPTFEGAERAFYVYGNCKMRLGEGDVAKQAFLAHLKLNPEHAETLYSLGELALQAGDADAAIAYLLQAQSIFDSSPRGAAPMQKIDMARVHASLGTAYFQQGDLEKARDSIQASLKLYPDRPQSYYTLSRILARLGDKQGAQLATRRFEEMKAARSAGPTGSGSNAGDGRK